MSKHIIITDKNLGLKEIPERLVITPAEYIRSSYKTFLGGGKKQSSLKVINLCADYDYLSMGYYCTLMAEARGHRVIPALPAILDLNWKRLYQSALPEINEMLSKHYREEETSFNAHRLQIFFGRCDVPALKDIARKIFDYFRCPVLEVELRHKVNWEVVSIEPLPVNVLTPQQLERFKISLDMFTGAAWQNPKVKKIEKYWIAVLCSEHEKQPPSNKAALKKFIKAGEELGVFVELIDKDDFSDLLEYDALFIREGTKVDHHTYRFAKKAETEGMPCIDSTASIVRCANKIFIKELLDTHKIAAPKSVVVDRKNVKELSKSSVYPCVLKIPDGSFSRGIVKAVNEEEFVKKAKVLMDKSDVILAQEFVPSDFDWRVGVLNNKPLYVSKYYMAKDHWQIVRYDKNGKYQEGKAETLAVADAPEEVIETALKAAALIGDGLYGVDLKQIGEQILVIEINDNPNIDAGCEDIVLGLDLYKEVLKDLVRRIESRN